MSKKTKPTHVGAAPIEDFMMTGKLLAELHAHDPAQCLSAARSMGMSRRKAYYLMELHETYGKLKVPKNVLLEIGWTKLQIIRGVVNASNWDHWLALAKALAVHQLKDAVKGKPLEFGKHCLLFYLGSYEFDLVAGVLVKYGAEHEDRTIYGKEAALVKAMSRLQQLDTVVD